MKTINTALMAALLLLLPIKMSAESNNDIVPNVRLFDAPSCMRAVSEMSGNTNNAPPRLLLGDLALVLGLGQVELDPGFHPERSFIGRLFEDSLLEGELVNGGGNMLYWRDIFSFNWAVWPRIVLQWRFDNIGPSRAGMFGRRDESKVMLMIAVFP